MKAARYRGGAFHRRPVAGPSPAMVRGEVRGELLRPGRAGKEDLPPFGPVWVTRAWSFPAKPWGRLAGRHLPDAPLGGNARRAGKMGSVRPRRTAVQPYRTMSTVKAGAGKAKWPAPRRAE